MEKFTCRIGCSSAVEPRGKCECGLFGWEVLEGSPPREQLSVPIWVPQATPAGVKLVAIRTLVTTSLINRHKAYTDESPVGQVYRVPCFVCGRLNALCCLTVTQDEHLGIRGRCQHVRQKRGSSKEGCTTIMSMQVTADAEPVEIDVSRLLFMAGG